MLKELIELALQVGQGGDTEEALRAYAAVIPVRPNAERAAMMLLMAGQRLYGAIGEAHQNDLDAWEAAKSEAERLLDIVPLTVAPKGA